MKKNDILTHEGVVSFYNKISKMLGESCFALLVDISFLNVSHDNTLLIDLIS